MALLLGACSSGGGEAGSTAATTTVPAPATISLTSTAFADGGTIPVEYTCDGDNRPPPLAWTAAPAGTDHLRLDVFDPDAPGGGFVHWKVDSLPASATSVPAGTEGWRGPCPPKGADPHHYVFTVTAVGADDDAVATGRLVGLYRRRS